jgi:CDGSH iron-sulfur domain-containing protein 3
MSEPEVAGREPVEVELKAGTYKWCRCGKSVNQPYCDGAHRGSELRSLHFTLIEDKRVSLCMCKRTGSAPFCDGTHETLG